ncbi:MAG: hypothetical protein Q9222_003125 [Ikaeria aurantiellina]
MSFRFNFDISLDFPPPPSRSPRHVSNSDQASDGRPQVMKEDFPGWLQTARLHPRYSLRLLYFTTSIAGIILDNVVLTNLVVGLLWQLLTLFDVRLFHGRRIPNWALAIVETLGFTAFLALFVSHRMVIIDDTRYGNTLALGEILLLSYDSAVWVVLCLVHGILAVQCYAQGWRNVRPKRRGCPDCERVHAKGKCPAADEEEALLGREESDDEVVEAGPSTQTPQS